jgi:hypothetical protein
LWRHNTGVGGATVAPQSRHSAPQYAISFHHKNVCINRKYRALQKSRPRDLLTAGLQLQKPFNYARATENSGAMDQDSSISRFERVYMLSSSDMLF